MGMHFFKKFAAALAVAAIVTASGAVSSARAAEADDASGGIAIPNMYGGAAAGKKFRKPPITLTDDQKKKIKEIQGKYKEANNKLAKAVNTERAATDKLVHAEKLDDAAIRAQAMKAAQAEADLAVHSAHVLSDLRAVLTPEQIAKLKKGGGDRNIDRYFLWLTRRLAKE